MLFLKHHKRCGALKQQMGYQHRLVCRVKVFATEENLGFSLSSSTTFHIDVKAQ